MTAKTKQPPQEKNEPVVQPPPPETGFMEIATDMIDDPELPMRSDLTPASVEDLVMSIKQVGIIEALVLKPTNGRYEVIAGHRRLYAAKLAKIGIVPCFVRHADREQTEMLKAHENLYRKDVSPAEEAKYIDWLIQKQKLSPMRIAQMMNKSPSYVTDRLAILNYPDFLREAMDTGKISFSVAREFAHFDDEKQMRAAVFYAARGGMTQEMARKWVQDHRRQQENKALLLTPVTNGVPEGQPVEHLTTCVYCQKNLRLIDAQVVYIHADCLSAAQQPPEETPGTPAAVGM